MRRPIGKWIAVFLFLTLSAKTWAAREVALTFDDAPARSTSFFTSEERTRELIRQLKLAEVSEAMIFANPCAGEDEAKTLEQLRLYTQSQHLIGNHTCSHPRLDDVGYEAFAEDALLAEKKMSSLFSGQKFFRFPFLNEGTKVERRDKMRHWLAENHYRNGYVTIDNDDYLVSFKMNQAKALGLPIDLKVIEKIIVEHLVEMAEYYDGLAKTKLGLSPKHVILLHERDATVLFLGEVVKELRKRGWKIITVSEAYTDPIYSESPNNLYAGDGLITQLVREKTGETIDNDSYQKLEAKLNEALGIK